MSFIVVQTNMIMNEAWTYNRQGMNNNGWYCWRWVLSLCKLTRLWMRHDNVVSSMCQVSFLPYTQSYMGTGINFRPAPIFRTGVIHFCHPGLFWNCILSFSYTSQFWELYYCTNHSILLFHCFPTNTFRNVLLHFLSPTFLGQVHRSVLLHFSTAAPF